MIGLPNDFLHEGATGGGVIQVTIWLIGWLIDLINLFNLQ